MKIGEVYGNSNNRLLKSISTSGKSIFIDFKKQYDVYDENGQFTALFKYKKINIDCQTWLDVITNILMSPNPPSNTNCSWLITSNFGSYIILDFTFIEVNFYSWVILIELGNLISFIFLENSLRVDLISWKSMMVVVCILIWLLVWLEITVIKKFPFLETKCILNLKPFQQFPKEGSRLQLMKMVCRYLNR